MTNAVEIRITGCGRECVCVCGGVTSSSLRVIAQGHLYARCCLHCPLHLGPLSDECFRCRGDSAAPTAHRLGLSYGCRRRARASTEGREGRPINRSLTHPPTAGTTDGATSTRQPPCVRAVFTEQGLHTHTHACSCSSTGPRYC